MAKAIKLTDEDRRWRAQEDARTLTEALKIVQDKKRLIQAKKEARKLLIEKQKEVTELNKIIRNKANKGGLIKNERVSVKNRPKRRPKTQ